MKGLNPEARRVLELASAARTPSPQDKARVARRVALAVGAATTAAVPVSVVHAAKSAGAGKWALIGAASKAWIGTGALLATALTGYTLWSNSATPTRSHARTAATQLTAARATLGPTESHAHTATAAPAVIAPTAAHAKTATRLARNAAQPVRPAPAKPGSAHAALETAQQYAAPADARTNAAAEDTLGAELDLLHRAQVTWRAREAAGALALLNEHRARYPHSTLQPERDALQVLTLCELGKTADATRLARRVLAAAPHSPLRASLEESCALQ